MQESFWWWQCSDRYIVSLSPHLHAPFPPFSPSLISVMVSVDVKHHVHSLTQQWQITLETAIDFKSQLHEETTIYAILRTAEETQSTYLIQNYCKNE